MKKKGKRKKRKIGQMGWCHPVVSKCGKNQVSAAGPWPCTLSSGNAKQVSGGRQLLESRKKQVENAEKGNRKKRKIGWPGAIRQFRYAVKTGCRQPWAMPMHSQQRQYKIDAWRSLAALLALMEEEIRRARFHTKGGPRRRPATASARPSARQGRRIYIYICLFIYVFFSYTYVYMYLCNSKHTKCLFHGWLGPSLEAGPRFRFE